MLEWLGDHQYVLIVAVLIVMSIPIAMNARERKRAPPLHGPFTPDQVLFEEARVSGASDLNFSTRLGGARNALVVRVLRDGVLIEPVNAVKWLMRPNFNDLEHFIPPRNLLSVDRANADGRDQITLQFHGQDGVQRKLWLYLRQPEEFVSAVAGLRAA